MKERVKPTVLTEQDFQRDLNGDCIVPKNSCVVICDSLQFAGITEEEDSTIYRFLTAGASFDPVYLLGCTTYLITQPSVISYPDTSYPNSPFMNYIDVNLSEEGGVCIRNSNNNELKETHNSLVLQDLSERNNPLLQELVHLCTANELPVRQLYCLLDEVLKNIKNNMGFSWRALIYNALCNQWERDKTTNNIKEFSNFLTENLSSQEVVGLCMAVIKGAAKRVDTQLFQDNTLLKHV